MQKIQINNVYTTSILNQRKIAWETYSKMRKVKLIDYPEKKKRGLYYIVAMDGDLMGRIIYIGATGNIYRRHTNQLTGTKTSQIHDFCKKHGITQRKCQIFYFDMVMKYPELENEDILALEKFVIADFQDSHNLANEYQKDIPKKYHMRIERHKDKIDYGAFRYVAKRPMKPREKLDK